MKWQIEMEQVPQVMGAEMEVVMLKAEEQVRAQAGKRVVKKAGVEY